MASVRMFSLAYLRRPLLPVNLIFSRTRAGVQIQSKFQLQKEFKLYLDSATKDDQQLVDFIKSCATLRYEAPAQRIKLANDMIQKIKKQSVVPSLQVKNTLLQLYLKNRHKFSPSKFLQQMKDDSVIPNSGTLYLLLQAYCHQGNIEGANAILEEIINNGLAINEDIYAALMMCNAISGDMSGAKDILGTMKQNGLTPTQTAYSALLSGYAYHGDFESIRRTIDDLKSENFYVNHDMYIDMLDALSLGGQSDKMTELLDMVQNKLLMYNELLHKMEVFASHGDLVGTRVILETLVDIDSSVLSLSDPYGETNLKTRGARSLAMLMHSLEQDKLKLSDVLSSIPLFERAGISNVALYEMLLRATIDTRNWTNYKTILVKMAAEGIPLKKLYIYPAIAFSNMSNNKTELKEWIHFIKQHNIRFDNLMCYFYRNALKEDFSTFFDLIYNKDDLSQLHIIVKMLCINGTVSHVQHFTKFLNDHNSDMLNVHVRHLIKTVRLEFNHKIFCEPAALSALMSGLSSLCTTQSHEELYTSTVRYIVQNIVLYKDKFPNNYLKTFLKFDDEIIDDNTLHRVMKLCRGSIKFHDIVQLLKSRDIKPECVQYEIINKLGHNGRYPSLVMSSFKAMNRVGCSVSSSVYDNVMCTLVRIGATSQALIVYDKMRKKMSDPLSAATYTRFIDQLLSLSRHSTAEGLKSEMETNNIPLNIHLVNNFIQLYGMKGDVAKAQEQFKKLETLNLKPTVKTYYQLMEGYCYHGDVAAVKSLLDEARSTVGIDSSLLEQVLKSFIVSGDYDGAVLYLSESFSKGCHVQSRPCVALIDKCEAAKRRDLTRQILSYLSSIGCKEPDTDFTFMLALLMTGQHDEAVGLVNGKKDSTLTLATLNHYTGGLSTDGKVAHIKAVIKLARELKMDTSLMNKLLIQALGSKRDIHGILQVNEELESAGIKPHISFYKLKDELIGQYEKERKMEEALRLLK